MKRRTGRCQIVTVEIDGKPTPVRVQAGGDMDETELGYLAEIIAAARRKFEAEGGFADVCPDCGIRTSAPGHEGHHGRWQRKAEQARKAQNHPDGT